MAPNNYALLIGIEDYSTFDRSEGRAPGTSDVAGAVQDARVWFRQCRRWGFSLDRIRVLTSPPLRPSDLGPDATAQNVGDASAASIARGIEWLEASLTGPEPSAGLLTYSGHGEQARGVLLCPSDMTADDQKLIHLSEWRQIVGGRFTGSLTIVVDACRENAAYRPAVTVRRRIRGWNRRLRGGHGAGRESREPFRRGPGSGSGPGDSRVLAACEPNATAASASFGGVIMGAFTWALTSALGQWQSVEDRGVVRLDVSHGELVHRARMLLRALSFTQTPTLMGAPLLDKLAFLEPEAQKLPGQLRTEPTARRSRRQLDPGELDFREYEIRFDDGGQVVPVARILVTAARGTIETSAGAFDLSSDEEYWFVSGAALSSLARSTSGTLSLSVVGDYRYSPGEGDRAWSGDVGGFDLVQETPAPAVWRAGALWTAGAHLFESRADSVALGLVLEADPRAGSTGFARIDWYQLGVSPLFRGVAEGRLELRRIDARSPVDARYFQAITSFEPFADLA